MASLAVVILAVVAGAGLAVDTGNLFLNRRQAQGAADAAALAGLLERQRGGDSAQIVATARAAAGWNGCAHGQDGAAVNVNSPPLAGRYAGDAGAVEVTVSRTTPLFFLGVVGASAGVARARAVARHGPGTSCVYVLHPTASDAAQMTGNVRARPSCDVHIASNANRAFFLTGNAQLRMRQQAGVSIVGQLVKAGNALLVKDETGAALAATHIAGPVADPLAALPAPPSAPIRCASRVTYKDGSPPTAACPGSAGPDYMQIQPGVYCGGILADGDMPTPLMLLPGTYILAGGGFHATGNARITATGGVTLYLTAGGQFGCPSSSYGPFLIDNNATLAITAPSSGSWNGIAIYQDRSISNPADSITSGNSVITINGAIYLPGSKLWLTGNSTLGTNMLLVVRSLVFSGNATFDLNYALAGGNPIRTGVLLAE